MGGAGLVLWNVPKYEAEARVHGANLHQYDQVRRCLALHSVDLFSRLWRGASKRYCITI